MEKQKSLFDLSVDPIRMAGLACLISLGFMLIAKLIQASGLIDISQRFPWMTAAAFMLVFALFNSIFSISSPNLNKYWSRSIFSFAGLAAANGLLAYLLSGLTIWEAGSYSWIYVVLTFGYLVFISLMGFLKKIVEFAQREEWNQPRLRQRNRKGK